MVDGPEGPFAAYLAVPDGDGPFPVVVVLGEIFGLNDVQRAAADRVAGLGHVAVAPNLLHRLTELPSLPEDDDGRALGLELSARLTRDEVLSDLSHAVAHARSHPAAQRDGPAGIVGFSFGGHVAVLAAALLGLQPAVALYAGWLTGTDIALSRPQPTATLAGEIAANGGRVLMLVGEDDPMVPPDDLEVLRRTFTEAGAPLELVTYPGVGHRFCAEGRPGHDPAAEHDAWQRIAAHLKR